MRRIDVADHAQHVVGAVGHRRVVLQRERDAGVAGEARGLGQARAAPFPGFCRLDAEMRLAPELPRDQVGGAFRRQRHAGPRREHAQRLRAEIRGHANQVAHVHELALAVLRDRAAEVVVRRDGVDLDARVVRPPLQVAAARARQIDRVAVRPLAVDLHAVVAEPRGPLDQLLEGQRRSAIPEAEVGDAVEAEFHGRIIALSPHAPAAVYIGRGHIDLRSFQCSRNLRPISRPSRRRLLHPGAGGADAGAARRSASSRSARIPTTRS